MKTSSIVSFYNYILKLRGPAEAKRTASDVLYIIITNIQEEGMVVTNDELEKRFKTYMNAYIKASKKNVA